MSTITIQQDGILQALKVNGRVLAYDGRIHAIRKVSAGRWEGEACGEPFTLIGGRAAGGSEREWYVQWAPGYGEAFIPAKSAFHALSLIEVC